MERAVDSASVCSPLGPPASDGCATGLGFQELFKESKEHFTCTNQLCWVVTVPELTAQVVKQRQCHDSGAAAVVPYQPECAYIVSSRDQVPSKCQR